MTVISLILLKAGFFFNFLNYIMSVFIQRELARQTFEVISEFTRSLELDGKVPFILSALVFHWNS